MDSTVAKTTAEGSGVFTKLRKAAQPSAEVSSDTKRSPSADAESESVMNPTLADIFAQMDYMERKGSGLGLMLDAYAKEVSNPRRLEPKFYSSSVSFHVVLPNLNFDVTQGVTQDVTQGVTQGVTQASLSRFDLKIVEHIREHSKVTTEELAKRLGCVPMTIKRHLAKLPNVRYVGHGYSGHWEVD